MSRGVPLPWQQQLFCANTSQIEGRVRLPSVEMKTNPPFDLVVREHGPAVLRMCSSLLGAGADAQDAWSETFLAALRAYPQLAVGANVQAWLITIAKRKAIDALRSKHPIPVEFLPEQEASVEGLGDLELLESLHSLTELQRKVIGYHYLLGFPYADIPAFLGGTAASLRRAAADGIKTLRKELTNSKDLS